MICSRAPGAQRDTWLRSRLLRCSPASKCRIESPRGATVSHSYLPRPAPPLRRKKSTDAQLGQEPWRVRTLRTATQPASQPTVQSAAQPALSSCCSQAGAEAATRGAAPLDGGCVLQLAVQHAVQLAVQRAVRRAHGALLGRASYTLRKDGPAPAEGRPGAGGDYRSRRLEKCLARERLPEPNQRKRQKREREGEGGREKRRGPLAGEQERLRRDLGQQREALTARLSRLGPSPCQPPLRRRTHPHPFLRPPRPLPRTFPTECRTAASPTS